jgi:hypothetical protein
MTTDRKDLSSWVIHFVHRRVPENNPAYNINEGEELPAFPYHEDYEINSGFESWEMVDESHALAPDESAIAVLLKIIQDGHIRAGWAFRNDKPTIYGPRAACCFTEMPLYGFLEYAASRSKESVDTYAIGLRKEELFAAGGRPVIYGLTGPHRELASDPMPCEPHYRWPRKLHPDCGITEAEQYRYVAMSLGTSKRIDWSHEREWRWAVSGQCSCPGLPVWLKDEPIQFTQAIVIVPKAKQANLVLDQIKELYDARYHNFDYAYNLELLSNTRILALENIADIGKKQLVRLEDLPTSALSLFKHPPASKTMCDRVAAALKTAAAAAKTAAAKANDGKLDVCGFAHITVLDPQSEFVSALIKLRKVDVIGGVGYAIRDIETRFSQSLRVQEAAAEAAVAELRKTFPDVHFVVRTQWD